MKTGSILKLLRAADGISQTALAEELGVARTYLSQIENNKVQPGLQLLRNISRRFDLPLSLLVIDPIDEDKEIFLELQNLLGNVLSARLKLNRK
ncbi:MAG: helix-turn-helix transcriptional regulator [candidate division Zixibacteria bacterium]|nr:helix-turn-helix transcriptional regulator [candidate division Zixibacteria bacterium]